MTQLFVKYHHRTNPDNVFENHHVLREGVEEKEMRLNLIRRYNSSRLKVVKITKVEDQPEPV